MFSRDRGARLTETDGQPLRLNRAKSGQLNRPRFPNRKTGRNDAAHNPKRWSCVSLPPYALLQLRGARYSLCKAQIYFSHAYPRPLSGRIILLYIALTRQGNSRFFERGRLTRPFAWLFSHCGIFWKQATSLPLGAKTMQDNILFLFSFSLPGFFSFDQWLSFYTGLMRQTSRPSHASFRTR